ERQKKSLSFGARLSGGIIVLGIFLSVLGGFKLLDRGLPALDKAVSFTGQLQRVKIIHHNKGPRYVEVILYDKQAGFKRVKLAPFTNEWFEKLKAYTGNVVTVFTVDDVVIGVDAEDKELIPQEEMVVKHQENYIAEQRMASNILYAGIGLSVFWFLFLRRRFPVKISEL
ncbi:MAG: hypothetical protein L3J61_02735, partial [Ghiorsea sp.]|nr:hypothetical protein [Ghiorsea sp.]